jgi:hypothetical protein
MDLVGQHELDLGRRRGLLLYTNRHWTSIWSSGGVLVEQSAE